MRSDSPAMMWYNMIESYQPRYDTSTGMIDHINEWCRVYSNYSCTMSTMVHEHEKESSRSSMTRSATAHHGIMIVRRRGSLLPGKCKISYHTNMMHSRRRWHQHHTERNIRRIHQQQHSSLCAWQEEKGAKTNITEGIRDDEVNIDKAEV